MEKIKILYEVYVTFLIFQSSPGMSVLKPCFVLSIGCKSCCLPLTWEKAFSFGKNLGKKRARKCSLI